MTQDRQVLELAGHAATILLKNGAEIFRIQETMVRILQAYQVQDFNVYVISNGIFATVDEHGEAPLSLVRHVPLGNVNLRRISAVNQISRDIGAGLLSIEEAEARLTAAENGQNETKPILLLAGGLGAAGFCYLFGGSLTDSLAALPIGLLLQLYLFRPAKRHAPFMPYIWGSAFVTLMTAALCALLPVLQFHRVVVGGIILMVPGVAFSTSFREFFNGDYLSGVIHLISAILTAACIAIGVCGGVMLIRMWGGIAI